MLCVAAIVGSTPSDCWRVRVQSRRVVFERRFGRRVSLSLHVAGVGVPARRGPVWQSLPRARTAASTSSSNHQLAAGLMEVRSIEVRVVDCVFGFVEGGGCMFMHNNSVGGHGMETRLLARSLALMSQPLIELKCAKASARSPTRQDLHKPHLHKPHINTATQQSQWRAERNAANRAAERLHRPGSCVQHR
jgi:hypothetical protein